MSEAEIPTISSKLHACNYYCKPQDNIHVVVVTMRNGTVESATKHWGMLLGPHFISIRPATEILATEAIKHVHVPKDLDVAGYLPQLTPFLLTLVGTLEEPQSEATS